MTAPTGTGCRRADHSGVLSRQEIEGGARACACEPAREANRSGVNSVHATCAGSRSSDIAAEVCGTSTGTPVCSTLQTEQQPSWARWLVWSVLAGSGIAATVADDGAGERIGGGDAGRPACADGRKNLHHQRNQDYGKKILQPAHRKPILPSNLITLRVRSRDQVPGTMLRLQGVNPAKTDAF